MQRVQKLLSNYGYCSRRKAEELIKEGRVKVNDKEISIGDKATEDDTISVDDKLVEKQKKIYIIFNKPKRCVTALKDDQYKTIMEYINVKERVFPIGRLDYNTSGLLLLTNDGDFANRIMHPRYEIEKTYLVELNKPIQGRDILSVQKGIELEDGKTNPAKIKRHEHNLMEVIIHEGKNRIVRRMFEELEYKVYSLKRIKIGNLTLGNLKPGEYQIISKKELDSKLKTS